MTYFLVGHLCSKVFAWHATYLRSCPPTCTDKAMLLLLLDPVLLLLL